MIILFLFLLTIPSAWAGQYKPNELCMTAQVFGAPMQEVPCSDMKIRFQADCLAKMEAAMRAMEPWSMLNLGGWQMSFQYVNPKTDRVELPYEDPATYTPYGLTQTMNTKMGQLIVLWESTKRECWSKP